jgi:hypothetical protein
MVQKKIGKRKTKPIQDLIDIKCIVSFENTGAGNVGAILLERKGKMMLRFLHLTEGIHNDITFSKAEEVVAQLIGLAMEMPADESIMIQRNNFPNYQKRHDELESMMELDVRNPLNILAFKEQESLVAVSTSNLKRLRNKTEIIIWSSVTSTFLVEKMDPFATILHAIDEFGKTKSGEAAERKEESLIKFLTESWSRYLSWDQLFTTKLSCLEKLKFADADGVWEQVWDCHNRHSGWDAPTIPELLRVDVRSGKVIREVDSLSQLSTKSTLVVPPNSIPNSNYQSIQIDGKYAVSSIMVKQPSGWENEMYQLNFLADKFANSTDTSVVIDLRRGNQDSLAQKLQAFSKDAIRGQLAQDKRGESGMRDQVQLEKALEGERAIITGNVAIEYGWAQFVYRDTEKDAIAESHKQAGKFGNGEILVERVTNEETFFQSLPHVMEPLLGGKVNRMMQTDSMSFPAYLPLATPVSVAEKGIEMRAKYGHEPIYLDFSMFPGNFQVFGESRLAGKSVFVAHMLAWAMLMGRFVTIIDIPQNGEAASFKNYTEKVVCGDYFDIVGGECFYNFLETPTIPEGTPVALRIEMIKECTDNIKRILLAAVLGADLENSDYSTSAIDAMLTQLLGAFFGAREIQNRYRDAKSEEIGGLGSVAWEKMPTIIDLIKFMGIERINVQARSHDDEKNLGFIKSQLTAWFMGANCKAPSLTKPSTFTPTSRLLTIALRQFSNNDEAAVFGLVAQGLAYRRAIQYREQGTIIFNDENAIALQHKSLAQGLGALYANGLKANTIVGSAMQPPDTITQSEAAGLISANTRYTFLGKIADGTEHLYAEHLGIPVELVKRCCDSNFAVNKVGGYSSYLFKQDSTTTFVEVQPQNILLNVMRNNQDERKALAAKLKDCTSQAEIFRALQTV